MHLNIGLIGYGNWAPNIAKNIRANPKINLKWICDKNFDCIAKAKATFFTEVNYSNDYNKVFNDHTLNSIAISTQTSSHYSLVKHALTMGKHVFVEKPFTSTVDEAIELNELAKEMKLKIHVDHIMIYHPAIKKIKELIIDNEIGDILYFDCKRTNANQIRSDLSVMWDLSVHDLSIIDYLMDGKEPNNINVMGRKYFGSKENLSFLNISYPRFVSHLQSSSISHHKERKLTIVGKKKTLIFDDLKEDDKLKVYDKNTNLILGKKIDYNSQKFEQHNALYNSIENFRKIIDLNKQSVSGPDQAIRIQKILEKADKLMNNK